MSLRIHVPIVLALAMALAGPAFAQLAPHEPGTSREREMESFYYQGVPGNPATDPEDGLQVDFSGRVPPDGPGVVVRQAEENCHAHDTGIEGVPFHADRQCHAHPGGTPGVVPVR